MICLMFCVVLEWDVPMVVLLCVVLECDVLNVVCSVGIWCA